jgi:hypothetical protein
MNSFQQELLVDFPITIENKHVIQKEQAKLAILGRGIAGQDLIFSHKFRDDHLMKIDLGKTLLNLMMVSPGGMLVFFPSYTLI